MASIRECLSRCHIRPKYPLIDEEGDGVGPPGGDLVQLMDMLKSQFPTAYAYDVSVPYLVIRVTELPPPSQRPFTIGGRLVRFETSEFGGLMDFGCRGRGSRELDTINLGEEDQISDEIFDQVIKLFHRLGVQVNEVFNFERVWSIAVPSHTNLNMLPRMLAGQVACYRSESQLCEPEFPFLPEKRHHGNDDTDYTDLEEQSDAILRPGMKLCWWDWPRTTPIEELMRYRAPCWYRQSTSGILVVDHHGEPFITVSADGFGEGGSVEHPDPVNGSLVGKVVHTIRSAGLSLVKLKPGLKYTDTTLSSAARPGSIRATHLITACVPPYVRNYLPVEMYSPYTGGIIEGQVIGIGRKLFEKIGYRTEWVPYLWIIFENGDELVDEHAGSPIFDRHGTVLGFYRYKMGGGKGCLAVSATVLKSNDFGFRYGEWTF